MEMRDGGELREQRKDGDDDSGEVYFFTCQPQAYNSYRQQKAKNNGEEENDERKKKRNAFGPFQEGG